VENFQHLTVGGVREVRYATAFSFLLKIY